MRYVNKSLVKYFRIVLRHTSSTIIFKYLCWRRAKSHVIIIIIVISELPCICIFYTFVNERCGWRSRLEHSPRVRKSQPRQTYSVSRKNKKKNRVYYMCMYSYIRVCTHPFSFPSNSSRKVRACIYVHIIYHRVHGVTQGSRQNVWASWFQRNGESIFFA